MKLVATWGLTWVACAALTLYWTFVDLNPDGALPMAIVSWGVAIYTGQAFDRTRSRNSR